MLVERGERRSDEATKRRSDGATERRREGIAWGRFSTARMRR
jgi:hypothetical protein